MSFSIQTNLNSLTAQENLRVNSDFQSRTIQRLTSGYRINSSGDDAAGLAVANLYRSDRTELSQGVRNANDGISQLQIIDGGLSNISQTLDRLKTLATQSASTTFTGDRSTLNTEYQSLLTEITRQASNVGLNANGKFNTTIGVYIGGGGSTQTNSQVSINLSGASNQVDAAGLGIGATSIQGGGAALTGNTVRLDAPGATFANATTLSFGLIQNGVATTVSASSVNGQTATQALQSLNSTLNPYGITAQINATSGQLTFAGNTAFSVSTTTAGSLVTAGSTAINTGDYNVAGTLIAAGGAAETLTIQNGQGRATVTINNGDTLTTALQSFNSAASSIGVYAVRDAAGTGVSIQSTNAFTITSTGAAFLGSATPAITAPTAASTSTGNALAALTSIETAVSNLGLVQGRVGTGENKLQYAINLANSQISSFSAAESRIRDTDTAAEAANLTKAQVLQQAAIAATAQANSAPQQILTLLRG